MIALLAMVRELGPGSVALVLALLVHVLARGVALLEEGLGLEEVPDKWVR